MREEQGHGSLKVGAELGMLGYSDLIDKDVFPFLPGEASAVLAKAKAKAEAIRILAAALTQQVRPLAGSGG